jgi:hypothetical protein
MQLSDKQQRMLDDHKAESVLLNELMWSCSELKESVDTAINIVARIQAGDFGAMARLPDKAVVQKQQNRLVAAVGKYSEHLMRVYGDQQQKTS